MPVKDAKGVVIGILTSTNLTTFLVKRKLTLEDSIMKSVLKEYRRVSSGITLCELARIFVRHPFVLVDDKSIASNVDLLNFMKDHP